MRRRRVAMLVALAAVVIAGGYGFVRWRAEYRRTQAAALIARADEAQDAERARLLIAALKLTPGDEALRERIEQALDGPWWPEPEDAKADMSLRAARIAANDQQLWGIAARELAETHRVDEALAAAERMQELGSLGGQEELAMVSALAVARRPTEALDHLLRARELGALPPDKWPYVIHLGYVSDRADEVLRLVRELEDAAPRDAWLRWYVPALAATGRHREALAAAREVANQHPVDAVPMTAAAWSALELGDLDAVARLLRSNQATIIVAEACLLRTVYWCRRGDYELANIWLEHGLFLLADRKRGGGIMPGAPDARELLTTITDCAREAGDGVQELLLLGGASVGLEDTEAARRAYEAALDRQPGIEPAATFVRTGSLTEYFFPHGYPGDRRPSQILRDRVTVWQGEATE